jgi:hypothetical protein
LAISGPYTLKVTGKTDGAPFKADAAEVIVRRSAATSLLLWSVDTFERGLSIRSKDGIVTRRLVRIDPDYLQRLRAGFLQSNPAWRHNWPCYLANATANSPAFKSLRTLYPQAAAPDYIGDYIRSSSYVQTLRAASLRPVPDDPNPERHRAAMPIEQIIIEPFDDISTPSSYVEKQLLAARLKFIELRVAGIDVSTAQDQVASMLYGRPLTMALDERDFTALAKFAPNNKESLPLFCLA